MQHRKDNRTKNGGSGGGSTNHKGRRLLLRSLAGAEGGFVSGEDLGKVIGASRAAVWKHIKHLRSEGIVVDSVPNKGYRLSPETDSVNPLLLPTDELGGLGFTVDYSLEVGSTNIRARELAQAGAAHGTVVVSEVQNVGRGRLARLWHSPRGGLWMSVILKPNIQPAQAPFVTVLAGTAVARALRDDFGINDAGIKWPNDILVNGRKLCGILTEMDAEMSRVNHIIIGIGINVNNDVSKFPNGLRETVTSMCRESGGTKVHRPKLLLSILSSLKIHLDKMNDETGRAEVLASWKTMSATLGKEVKVEMVDRTVEGSALDVDEEGALILETKDGGRERVVSGDCVHLR